MMMMMMMMYLQCHMFLFFFLIPVLSQHSVIAFQENKDITHSLTFRSVTEVDELSAVLCSKSKLYENWV
jgi:hypothetical protein